MAKSNKKKNKPKPSKPVKKDSKPVKAVEKPVPKPSKPAVKEGKPETLNYVSAQYPIKELYSALFSRATSLANAGYTCLWHPIDLVADKELLVPFYSQKSDDRTIRCSPIIVSERKTGSAPVLQLGMELDILENVAVLKGVGKVPGNETRYEIVFEVLSQFKALTGIQLSVEAKA